MPPCKKTTPTKLAFIFSDVPGREALARAQPAGVRPIFLDDHADGLQQMAAHAGAQAAGIDAIHVLSHGRPGALRWGHAWIGEEELAQRTPELASIGACLSDSASILLYGCELDRDERGRGFISLLAQRTGAAVAASSTPTGSTQLGGDWHLDSRVGRPAVASLGERAPAMQAWNHVLATLPSTPNSVVHAEGADIESVYFDWATGWVTPWELKQTGSYTFTGSVNFASDVDNIPIFVAAGSSVTSFTIEYRNVSLGLDPKIHLSSLEAGTDQFFSLGSQTITQTLGSGNYMLGVAFNGSARLDYTITFHVTGPAAPALQAPSLSATGASASFIENGVAVDLFSGINAQTRDAGQTFTGMTLTVSNIGSANGALESLNIGGTSIALVNGSSVLAQGGNYSVSVNGTTATITLSNLNRPLKKCSSNAPGSWISKKRIAQTGLRSDWSGHFGLFAGRFARSGRTYPMVHA